MSLLAKSSSGKDILFIKGAPDYLIEASSKALTKSGKIVDLNESDKIKFENAVKVLAKRGLRTLAICVKEDVGVLAGYNGPTHKAHALLENMDTYADLEKEPVLVGVVALRDPPRPEVKHAIAKCKDAGISVIMITGDIKETAESIAKEITIINEGDEKTRSFTGHQFTAMDDRTKLDLLQKVCDHPSGLVFSRTDPKHKR
jgi:Ca2+-transporting ATPase